MERIYFIIVGLIVGIVFTILYLYKNAPNILVKESESAYNFEETLERLQSTIDSVGWKTPHVHDLQATMAKFNHEVNKVKVMEICKPDYAQMILSRDDERIVSTMMPCRISVYEKSDGKVYVSRLNSMQMGRLFGGVIKNAMDKADHESELIIQSVLK